MSMISSTSPIIKITKITRNSIMFKASKLFKLDVKKLISKISKIIIPPVLGVGNL